jgi:hypothetical protein
MDSVGADDKVIRARRTICEDHMHLVILLAQRREGCVKPHPDARGALQEDAMKLTASNGKAATDGVPEPGEIDFRQRCACVIENSLMRHADGASLYLVRQIKRGESANAVAGEVQARAARRPR